MNKHVFAMLTLLSLAAAPACVVTTTTREVGSVAADGSVYLGWNLIGNDGGKSNPFDTDTYDIGANFGGFSMLRLHADKPVAFAQIQVIFADGERWIAQGPPSLNADETSAPIVLPGGRAIHSVVIVGRATNSLLTKVEIYGLR